MKKYSISDLLYIFILLYALSTTAQDLYSIPLNRIWTGGMIVCMLYVIFHASYKSNMLCLGILSIVGIWTSLLAENITQNLNDYIYLFTATLWLMFMADKSNRIKLCRAANRNRVLTKGIIIASYAIILFSLLTKSGFSQQWGTSPYFVGFAGTQHSMASSMCLITAIFLLFAGEKSFSWWNLVVCMFGVYIVLETGARTFIVPICILAIYYIRKNVKNSILKTIIYSIGILVAIYMLLHTSMLNKFQFVSSGGNMAVNSVDGFTSGRSLFWTIDLQAFANGNIINVLLGRGFDYVYALNARTVNQRIWAHNDFIHLLLGGGLCAFAVYMFSIFCFFYRVLYTHNKIDKVILIVYLFFPAIVNGFFMYQHLLLSMMVLCVCYSCNNNENHLKPKVKGKARPPFENNRTSRLNKSISDSLKGTGC